MQATVNIPDQLPAQLVQQQIQQFEAHLKTLALAFDGVSPEKSNWSETPLARALGSEPDFPDVEDDLCFEERNVL